MPKDTAENLKKLTAKDLIRKALITKNKTWGTPIKITKRVMVQAMKIMKRTRNMAVVMERKNKFYKNNNTKLLKSFK